MLDKTFASVGPGARVPSSQLLILAAENCSVRFANSLMVMPIFFRLTVILSPMRCWYEALKDLTSDDLNYGFKKMLVTITDEERKRREAWPPNVKEFRMYCERRLQDFDLPQIH